MAKLLYAEASPGKERSASTGVAKAFVPEPAERTKAEAAGRTRSVAGAF
jgi:FMN-dependent NADH-azoreductase